GASGSCPRRRAAHRGARRPRRRLPAGRSAAEAPQPRGQPRVLLRHGALPRAAAGPAAPGHPATRRRRIRRAHPGSRHARARGGTPADEGTGVSARTRRVAVLVAVVLAGLAAWRLLLAPSGL